MIITGNLDLQSAPFNGPFDGSAVLINGVSAAPVEGLWTQAGFAKVASIELVGSASPTFSAQLYGTNQPGAPLNIYTVTISGLVSVSDILALTFSNQNFPAGSVTISYTALSTDNVGSIAAALALLISANVTLGSVGLEATASAGVVTVTYPTVPSGGTFSSPGLFNTTTLTGLVNPGSETITIAAGTTGSVIGSAISSLGLTAITTLTRWVTIRLTSFTGPGTNLSAYWHGAA